MLKVITSIFALSLTSFMSYHFLSSGPLYSEKLKSISTHINGIPGHPWKAEFNSRFQGYDSEQMKQFFGSKPKDAIQKAELAQKSLKNQMSLNKLAVEVSAFLFPASELPANFDAREKWPKCKTLFDVRDQSRCGSCWAVSAATVMSARLCIGSDQRDQRYVSAEDIISCCPACGDGCLGGFEDAAFKYWVERGFVTGGDYDAFPESHVESCKPYPWPMCGHHVAPMLGVPDCLPNEPWFKTPVCKHECQAGYAKPYWQDLTKGRIWYTVSGEEDMMRDLFTNGPLSLSIELKEDFLVYKSGVYVYTKGGDVGGHAVSLFGWGEENGEKYWLIQNEWNPSWGIDGFAKIRRGVNELGIETDASSGLAAFENWKEYDVSDAGATTPLVPDSPKAPSAETEKEINSQSKKDEIKITEDKLDKELEHNALTKKPQAKVLPVLQPNTLMNAPVDA
jgi:cathepsin B